MAKFVLANTNLFIDGANTTGLIKMLDLDNLKAKTENYEALGMLFNKDVPVGFEQMKGKLTFAGPNQDFFNLVAFPFKTTPITLLGVMIDKSLAGGANNKQFKCDMTIRPDELGLGKYENQKLTEFERSFMVDKLTITMAGVEQLAIDTENNIYRVNGTDMWAEYRTLLGQ